MKKAGLETSLINLQRCDDSAAQEIRKMAPAGSLLDAERDCVIIVNKIGSMIGESTYETGLSIPATTWFQIKNVVSALGDCSADCSLQRLETLASSRFLVSSLFSIVRAWSEYVQEFRMRDLNECWNAHSCYHGAIYVLLGLISLPHGGSSFMKTLCEDVETLVKVGILFQLLQEEMQYSTQEMLLELLCRIFIYFQKKKMAEAEEFLCHAPTVLKKALLNSRQGPKGILEDLRGNLLKINSGNPNLVSVPVTSVSMSTKEGVISVGRVTHVDLGYTVLSMLVKNGPNIAIKYEKLARVNFINNKGTVKLLVDDSLHLLKSTLKLKNIKEDDQTAITIKLRSSDVKGIEILQSVIENRLQSLSDNAPVKKCSSVATSMNADLDTIPEQTADEPLNTKKGFSTRNRVDRSRLQTPLIGKDSDRRAITTIEENSLIGSKLLDTIPKSNALELPNYELISSKSVRIEHKKRAITTDFSSPPLYLKRKFGTELNTNDEYHHKKSRIKTCDAQIQEEPSANEYFPQFTLNIPGLGGSVNEMLKMSKQQSDFSDSVSEPDNMEQDQTSAMSLLLKELIIMNKSRADKYKGRKTLQAASVSIDQVCSYMSNWRLYAGGQLLSCLTPVQSEIDIISCNLLSLSGTLKVLFEKLSSLADASEIASQRILRDTDRLDNDIRSLIQSFLDEDSNLAIEISSRSKLVQKEGMKMHKHSHIKPDADPFEKFNIA